MMPGSRVVALAAALVVAAPLGVAAAQPSGADAADVVTAAADSYRARYHHTVPDHWKNDPQRPVYLDGEFRYHYLYNADYDQRVGTAWRMTAVSREFRNIETR